MVYKVQYYKEGGTVDPTPFCNVFMALSTIRASHTTTAEKERWPEPELCISVHNKAALSALNWITHV